MKKIMQPEQCFWIQRTPYFWNVRRMARKIVRSKAHRNLNPPLVLYFIESCSSSNSSCNRIRFPGSQLNWKRETILVCWPEGKITTTATYKQTDVQWAPFLYIQMTLYIQFISYAVINFNLNSCVKQVDRIKWNKIKIRDMV